MTYEFRIEDCMYSRRHKLFIAKRLENKIYAAKPLEFEELKQGDYCNEVLAVDYNDGFPSRMKAELLRLGLLYNVDQATNEAIKYHLEDMRALAFKHSQGGSDA